MKALYWLSTDGTVSFSLTCECVNCKYYGTRSSAVAARPRDVAARPRSASSLSVVSFDSSIRGTQCFIISYFDSDLNVKVWTLAIAPLT